MSRPDEPRPLGADAGEQVRQAMAAGMTRRAALKRAGLVIGATAWATPVVQTVLAGTAAASGHPPPVTCTGSDANCGGNCPTKCGSGKFCKSNTDCLSSRCTASGAFKQCEPSRVGEPCLVAGDCTSGVCTNGVCQTAPAGGPCQNNNDCVTGRCTSRICARASVGGTCRTTSDCALTSGGLTVTCTSGICGGGGSSCSDGTQCRSGVCFAGLCTT